ncbi:TPA: hypothetical protein PW771_002785 [Mannheimia haemolytica]|nr:hypothetical protein [Mannheimia haemolytica]HDL4191242.1 hypothetical protein [Mannheimia haemolytica]
MAFQYDPQGKTVKPSTLTADPKRTLFTKRFLFGSQMLREWGNNKTLWRLSGWELQT